MTNTIKGLRALDFAKYVVTKCNSKGIPISNLKLQKMLYFLFLEALSEKNLYLFNDDFRAWKHGPVIKSVYEYFSDNIGVYLILSYPEKIKLVEKYLGDNDLLESLELKIDELSNKNAWQLVKMSHKENGAWYQTYNKGTGKNKIIDKKLIEVEAE